MYLLAFLDDTLPWTYPTAIGFALPCNQATSDTDGSVSSGASQGSPSPDGTVDALAHPTTPAATFTPRTHPHETPLLHITIARISFATFFGVFIPELRVHKSCSDRRLPIGAQPFGLALCMLAEENGGKSNNKKRTKKQKKEEEEEEKQEERRHLPPNEIPHQQTIVSSIICLQQNPEHGRFASKIRKTPQYLPKPRLLILASQLSHYLRLGTPCGKSPKLLHTDFVQGASHSPPTAAKQQPGDLPSAASIPIEPSAQDHQCLSTAPLNHP